MPLTYGFYSYPPRAQLYTNAFTGAATATPVLDLVMDQSGAGIVPDRTAYGNNGTCSGCVGARGVFDVGQKFNGVNNTINCGSNASLDIAGNISASAWINTNLTGVNQSVLAKRDGAAAGWIFYVATTNVLALYFDTGFSILGTTVVTGTGFHQVAVTVSGVVGRLFLDGLQEARGTASMTDSGADSLYVGSSRGSALYFGGKIELPQEWNGVTSPEQMYQNYLSAKDAPIYYDTFERYPTSLVVQTAGSMCGPFRLDSGTFYISADADGKKWFTCVTAGCGSRSHDLAYGTFEFDVYTIIPGPDFLVNLISSVPGPYNVSAAQNGYTLHINTNGAIIIYRITAGVAAGTVLYTADGTISSATAYKVRVVRRVDGQFTIYLKGGVYTDWCFPLPGSSIVAVDNVHKTSAYSSVYFTSADLKTSGVTALLPCVRPEAFPWEFSTGTYSGLISGSTSWMYCLTAGVTFLPKDLDWQTATFGFYKGGGANVIDICFVASEIGGTTFADQNGYCLRVAADESLQLIRMSAGVETQLATTAAAFVANTTEYTIKIQHNGTTNAYDFLIRGGAYSDWTATGLAATLGIYTSSNYVTWDLDVADRVTAPQFYRDLR